jgi:hypothetical protein
MKKRTFVIGHQLSASNKILLYMCNVDKMYSQTYFFLFIIAFAYGASKVAGVEPTTVKKSALPNVLVFIVDDLGWNQVGYHASKVGNNEIQTPNIDKAAKEGIELNRGYVTPWYVPENIYNITITTDSSNGH